MLYVFGKIPFTGISILAVSWVEHNRIFRRWFLGLNLPMRSNNVINCFFLLARRADDVQRKPQDSVHKDYIAYHAARAVPHPNLGSL